MVIIPDVAKYFDVECIVLWDMLEALGWRV